MEFDNFVFENKLLTSKSIGQRIKSLRKNLNMTQEELAKKVGYTSRTSINKIESGQVDLSSTKIQKFAEALNTEPEYLLGLNIHKDENTDKVKKYYVTIHIDTNTKTYFMTKVQANSIEALSKEFSKINKDKDNEE